MAKADSGPVDRVLVVDDAEEVRALLRAALEEEGYAVELARDGQEGIAALARFGPDVILLDLMMPNVSGWEFMSRYRELPRPHVPGIVLSAIPPHALSMRALDVEAIMPKPISLDRLLAAIGSHLRRMSEEGGAGDRREQRQHEERGIAPPQRA